jgi:hypothetical protein
MQVDEVTKAFHEISRYRADHLRKALGGFTESGLCTGDTFEKAKRFKRIEGTPDPQNPNKVWHISPSGSGHYVEKVKVPTSKDYYDKCEIIVNLLQLHRGNKVFVKIGNADRGFMYSFGKIKNAAKDNLDDVVVELKSGGTISIKPGSEWRIRRFTKTIEGQIDPSEAGKVKAADGPEAREVTKDED